MTQSQIIKVGVVEDNHEFRNALKLILNSTEGFQCVALYPKGEEAIEAAAQLDVDIMLMDIQLPGISGIECVRKIKTINPKIQFMMFTAYEDDDKIFDALQAGAAGYILKRTPPAKLVEAITELYNGGSPMNAEIARKVVGSFQAKPQKGTVAIENDPLTEREKEILNLLSEGYMYKEIAGNLFISMATVKQHVHRIYEKLHVQSRTAAINKYYVR